MKPVSGGGPAARDVSHVHPLARAPQIPAAAAESARRYVICDYSGHPFQVELSRELARRGHEVLHLHYAEFPTPKGKLRVMPGDPAGFEVEPVGTGQSFDKRHFLRRRFIEAKVGSLAGARAIAFVPDLVVGCNMPLDAQKNLRRTCARFHVPFVFWLQDIYSQAIHHFLGAKLGIAGKLIGRHYIRLEAELVRSSEAVVAISTKFCAPLERWRVDMKRVHVIPNWAPLSEIFPVAKSNDWARRHGLADKLVALYTGTLGLKHDPSLLLELARRGAGRGIEVVVVSEGPAVEWLMRRKREEGVGNLTLLPFQPMELYPKVLGTGDILLALLGEEAAEFSVPSKILSYLAAGKPVVGSIAPDNDAAAMIAAARCGITAAPGERQSFFDAVLNLADDGALRSAMGRRAREFAESHFDIAAIADRFEQVFAAVMPPIAQVRAAAETG
jgi:colanic acid biosynthesis glycosyl transferase WcaI